MRRQRTRGLTAAADVILILNFRSRRRIAHARHPPLRRATDLRFEGLTECSPLVAGNRDRAWKNDAAGLPLPGIDVRIHQPGSEGVGEIVVKGPSVMLGYYEQPEETARVFTADGYFRTGDLGYIDRDGFLHITGHAKNVIIKTTTKKIKRYMEKPV